VPRVKTVTSRLPPWCLFPPLTPAFHIFLFVIFREYFFFPPLSASSHPPPFIMRISFLWKLVFRCFQKVPFFRRAPLSALFLPWMPDCLAWVSPHIPLSSRAALLFLALSLPPLSPGPLAAP